MEKQKLIYLLSSFFIFWMGTATSVCYEMGKHGLENTDWGFVFKSNIPLMIIAGSLLFSAFKTEDKAHEMSMTKGNTKSNE